jgi:2-keto-3-deoxy-L-rhamnonate aldolase RhmA
VGSFSSSLAKPLLTQLSGNIDDRDMHDAVFAVAANNVSPIVRIRGTDATLIKRALDAGAQ